AELPDHPDRAVRPFHGGKGSWGGGWGRGGHPQQAGRHQLSQADQHRVGGQRWTGGLRDYYKSQALRNAKEAYEIHQARTRLFDEEAKDSRCASLHQASGGSGFGESYSLSNPSIQAGEDIPQPTIFNGKLKGYQLKGMNWLANLYEQVNTSFKR
uniref:Uncharacterized protein n=1 Tax=Hucho hucho TaxID=62062 RepID=A0A4W5L0W0_9TELE